MDRRYFMKTTALVSIGMVYGKSMFASSHADDTLYSFFKKEYPKCLNEPSGNLKYGFIDPGAGYRGLCWDWDAYFSLRGLKPFAKEVAPYALGCVKNFLGFQAPDGSIPYAVMPKRSMDLKARAADEDRNSCKPLLAQFTLMAHEYSEDDEILKFSYQGLAKHIAHWEKTQLSKLGLFTFRTHWGSGVDDHPAVFCKPLNSSADVYLNAMFYKEYLAMETIARKLGNNEAKKWKEKAKSLKDNINEHMWDPVDQMYYNLDVGYHKPGRLNQEVTWVNYQKVMSWTSFMPIWAGVAPKVRVELLVKKHLTNTEEFWSDNGMRSLAKNEPAYEIAVGSNPSCWRGPIWVVNNYLIYEGLLSYGYKK